MNKAKIDKAAVRRAMEELRKAGKNHQSISAIREALGGVGSNETVQTLRDEIIADMAREAAAVRKLTPTQQAMALQMMERAVSTISSEIESVADERIKDCQAKAESEVLRHRALAEEALVEAGKRVNERDEARLKISELEQLQRSTQDRAIRLEALLEARGVEVVNLRDSHHRALAERDSALSEAAELRGRLAAMAPMKSHPAEDLGGSPSAS